MGDPVEDSPLELRRRGYEPLLQQVAGWIRFDLYHGHEVDHWRIGIDQGDLSVTARIARRRAWRRRIGRP